jgi:nickel/cobalt transporter (NicO) family protein
VIRRLLVGGVLTAAILGGSATAASAHPLGNFTVNHYDGLVVSPNRVTDYAVIDAAEIPTLQDKTAIDADHNGTISAAERAAYSVSECRSLAQGLSAKVGSHRLSWQVGAAAFTYRPGSAGLQTSRLTCRLSATAPLGTAAVLDFSDGYRGDRVGWHEITANGSGVGIEHSPVPQRSVSDELLHYPNDLLSSPLGVRSADLHTRPGGISSIGALPSLPTADSFSRLINTVTGTFNGLVGSRHLTLSVGLLALLLSVVLGASHAAMPGHGKTVMAAYITGRRGRMRDAVTVGVTVTFTHTAGVLVLGGLLTASASLAGESLLSYLGVISGLMVAGIGVGLLRTAWRDHRATARSAEIELAESGVALEPELALAHSGEHGHGHEVAVREPEAEHGHGHGHGGLFDKIPEARFGRKGLIGLGIAGGLVPSPSALVVLLGAIALGRTVFGVALVLGYGLGMAGTLTAAGLLLVRLRSTLERATITDRLSRMTRLTLVTPLLTAGLVIIVGAGLVIRSLSGTV